MNGPFRHLMFERESSRASFCPLAGLDCACSQGFVVLSLAIRNGRLS